jgi:hypothetical protein
MAAYMKALELVCIGCQKRKATHEVFDTLNQSRGEYCKACAERRVKFLNNPCPQLEKKS